MDLINTLLIVSIVINSGLGLALLIHGKQRRKVTLVYAFNVLMILAWISSIFFYRTADAASVLLWTKILYLSASFVASSFFIFTYFFPKVESDKNIFERFALILLPNIAIAVLIIFGDPIIESAVVRSDTENFIFFGKFYFLYVIYILFYFNFAYYRLYKKNRETQNPIRKAQTRYVLIGYVTAGIIAFTTNLILPWLSVFSFNWVGQISTLLMVGFATFAILKHELLNVKVVSTELFVFLLWVFLLMRTTISSSFQEQLINGFLLAATIAIGLLLIKSVQKEVEDREKIEKLADELRHANKRLKVLDKQKSQFLSIASHQFRSPLTAIKGYLSLLIEGTYGEVPAKLKKPIERAMTSAENLVIVVEDFLNVSRIEQGRMKYDFDLKDVKDIVKQVYEEQETNIEKKDLDPKFIYDKTKSYETKVDEGKLRQVFINLIDNAIKYTPEGYVHVRLEKDERNNCIRFTVEDSGVGVDEKEKDSIFNEFSRSKSANEVNVMGTGLGLYIVKEIVNAHHGTVTVESNGKGEGSTFIVELPISK